ncbi:YggS family pyridoxal phosphate-dependent enzyme [Campylobacter hepaticus]|uniref:Pyridoxal phosphate homeostasis protein n=1 Tax=Campylobacter hepaticus TaxID=1813019 RepID=A0A424YZY9_9BACT|nr:YggS family pyridoxal phosphate-dependent enzyme [Campylobacter hepaticus]RQD69045.1 YggS family pyridoxal phosphate-dependent enzyme [Campylobacter hepaticus]RQD87212.1 YggS family pyridoxal phosphate-dependent enzyme [Campylobacter hepaticus]
MTIQQILEQTKNIRLIAASKYVDANIIEKIYTQGIVEFGENQVQALAQKKYILDNKNLNIKWHFIGTLQSNKINLLIKQKPILWHSCNGIKIAQAVNKRLNYKLDTLLEINSANEYSKSGLNPDIAIEEYLKIQEECPNLNLCGVMSIGSHSKNTYEIIKSFEHTFNIYEKLQKYGAKICSMGMSSDFKLAIQCGSNMIRLGKILFDQFK